MTELRRPPLALRLQAEREARGWSKKEMARRLLSAAGYEGGSAESLTRQIRDWEAGKHFPRDWTTAYATAFGVSEDDLLGAAKPKRHDILEIGLTTIDLAPYPPHQGPVAPELVMYFLEQLPGHYKADMWLGPRHLIPTVTTQAELIKQLAHAADAPVRRGLLGAGVAYGALLGWLYQDAGDINRSGFWRAVALDMALRSQDPQLISYALTNKAMLAIDVGDGRTVVDYAESALMDRSKLCPKVRILALVHQAHGNSMLPAKDTDLVDRLLDEAAALVDQVDDEHPWGNACHRSPGYIDVQRATAYLRLGLYREAVTLWDRILGTVPESARRDNGVFWARQAGALAEVAEPERVVQIATATAAMVQETGSARLRQELRAIPRRATAWAGTAPGRELAEIMSQIA
ncbi:helix-turn-helix domain-containing protein [Sphaerisporangium viridialbum]|uniref:helix-turn-helix domain-containing protein n=1 Tax=Sphaerisporangium viridialbum TaxID=46189 RepID=UPI003C727A44